MNPANENSLYTFKVNKEYKKLRDFLKASEVSTRYIKRAIKNSEIFLNGKRIKTNHAVAPGDEVKLLIPDEEYNVICEEGDLEIIYEDADLLAVNKPPGLIVHAVGIEQTGTLSNYVGGYFKSIGLKRKVRVINRLDRDTSGIVLFAKNSLAHSKMAPQFLERSVEKIYIAAVKGYLEGEGTVEGGILLSDDGIKREVSEEGKDAVTKYEEIGRTSVGSILKLQILTGRTHQIRVHLSSLGHPILGDTLYGGECELIGRQALHSYSISFKHPKTGEEIYLKARIPEDIRKITTDFTDY